MASVVKLSSGAVLKNVTLPASVHIFIGADTKNVTITNVSSAGSNTDRPDIYYGEGCKNITVDGKKTC
jgi:D-lyxose ketol-isomerase